jgi:hypothetical protein
MAAGAVPFMRVDARPTAVIAQTTTWEAFPTVWRQCLDQVYRLVRGRPDLASGEVESGGRT